MKEHAKNLALEELRVLAALMVLGVHAGQKAGLGGITAVGAQGVTLFFILSGYLTAASLERHPDPRTYYKRRAARILPLYWLVLALRYLYDAVRYLASGMTAAQVFTGPCGPGYLRYVFFLQLWLPSDDWMLWNNRNVLWTMSSFAFFYLIAPLLARLCRRFWGAMACLLVCLAGKGMLGSWVERSLAGWPASADISEFSARIPPMTLYCFLFGMAAFAALREGRQYLYGAFCLLLPALFGFERCAYEGVFTVLVLLAAQAPGGLWPSAAAGRPGRALRFLSAGSFWLYLAHPMVLDLLPNGRTGWLWFAAVLAVCLTVCYALYALAVRHLEARFRPQKSR